PITFTFFYLSVSATPHTYILSLHDALPISIKNDVLFLSRRAASLHHDSDRVRRALWGMRHTRWNEERLTLAHDMINNAIPLADAHFDVALELVEILFRIDQMKVIPRVGTLNDHHEKVASVIKITVAHRRLELFPVLFDPVFQINRRLHSGHKTERISVGVRR